MLNLKDLLPKIGAEFTILPNAGHGGSDFNAYKPQIVEFFNKHLKK